METRIVYARKPMPTTSRLLDRTVKMMKERDPELTYEVMSIETGIGIAWFARFATGRVKNPNVIFIEALHDYLEEKAASK